MPIESPPVVTVVIPCFNQARYLPRALASVHAQGWRPIESIVIDDGSADDTAAVAVAHGATRVKRQANRGLSCARNAGLANALGEFVVFLDADDELIPGALAGGVDLLQQNLWASCAAGRCRLMDANGRSLTTKRPVLATADVYRELLYRNFVWTPGAAIFRRAAIEAIGGFPAELSAAADYAVFLALARRGQLLIHSQDTVRYRKHAANMSRDSLLMLRTTLAVHCRERPFVGPQHVQAYAEGHREWADYYGTQVIDQMRDEWHGRRRLRVLGVRLAALLRHCPWLICQHAIRKCARTLRLSRVMSCRAAVRIAHPSRTESATGGEAS